MNFLSVFGTAVGLSMDAFAVSVSKGLSLGNGLKLKHALKVGLYFGIFQAGMPLIGYFLASIFAKYIEAADHWIAFGLLTVIGLKMLSEAFDNKESDVDSALDFKTMLMLSIATSIDAMAAGVVFSFQDINIYLAVAIVGVTTFLFSFVGVKIGNLFGGKLSNKAEICGGIILMLMGLKILFEHLGVFG